MLHTMWNRGTDSLLTDNDQVYTGKLALTKGVWKWKIGLDYCHYGARKENSEMRNTTKHSPGAST